MKINICFLLICFLCYGCNSQKTERIKVGELDNIIRQIESIIITQQPDRVYNDSNFDDLCDFAGYPHTFGAACQITSQGILTKLIDVEKGLMECQQKAIKGNNKELTEILNETIHDIGYVKQECGAARVVSSDYPSFEKHHSMAIGRLNLIITKLDKCEEIIILN